MKFPNKEHFKIGHFVMLSLINYSETFIKRPRVG